MAISEAYGLSRVSDYGEYVLKTHTLYVKSKSVVSHLIVSSADVASGGGHGCILR